MAEKPKKQQTSCVNVWGRAGDGQLGVPNDEGGYVSRPLRIPQEYLEDPSPCFVSCGGKHSLILTESGSIYSFGWNWRGQLGHGDVKDCIYPKLIKSIALMTALQRKTVVKVDAGDEHSVALTSDGRVYTWGSNSEGGLGQDEVKGMCLQPRLLLPLHKYNVLDISCGGSHVACTTDQGLAFTWGKGSKGRLGHGTSDSQLLPKNIVSLSGIKIVQVACGWSHSLFLSSEGHVFACGSGRDGTLGIGNREDVHVPFLVRSLQEKNIRIVKIFAGYYQSAAIDDQHQLYTWGWGDDGQLGHGRRSELLPKRVAFFEGKKVTDCAFGGFHTMAIADNRCYTWGAGAYHQLGNGETSCSLQPKIVDDLKDHHCVAIRSGLWHSIAITVPPEQEFDHATTTENEIQVQPSPKLKRNNVVDGGTTSLVDEEIAQLRKEMLELRASQDGFNNSEKQDSGISDSSEVPQGLGNVASSGSAEITPPTSPIASAFDKIGRMFSYGIFGDAAERQQEREAKRRAEEVKARKKLKSQEALTAEWNEKVLSRWDDVWHTPEVRRLWMKGIPTALRKSVWKMLIPNKLGITMDQFEDLKSKARDDWVNDQARRDESTSQSLFHVIEVDVPRTFTETGLFAATGPLHGPLTDILRAYSIMNTKLGYVQGMSFLAGMLLFYMDTYDAFVMFANLLESHFFCSLFKMDLPQIFRHMRVYELLFEQHMPKLCHHFNDLGISPEQYLLDWFMTVFGRAMGLEASSRVWDCFLLEGEPFLYRTALGILNIHEKRLLKSSFEEIVKELRTICKGVSDMDLFKSIKTITVPKALLIFLKSLEQSHQSSLKSEDAIAAEFVDVNT